MRLATIAMGSATSAVVVRGDQAVPIEGYSDVGALVRDPEGLDVACECARQDSAGQPFMRERLLRPVLSPGAIVCVGLNYRSHILEMDRELPTSPTLFSKLPRAMADPYADITLPTSSQQVDYEAELAVVIGKSGRDIRPNAAWDYVAGLTILNDVTARDYQRRSAQWFAGKTFQASTPWGPWIVTPDELPDLSDKRVRLTVNGAEHQNATLGDLVFDVPTLVSDLSRIVSVEPGDVIATGTPGGVGAARGEFLQPGDQVVVEIDGIGDLRNTFRAAAA
jgi:acylpyruvate hydrolase